MQGMNCVNLIGNLTRDPELRSVPSGQSVCSLRVACNGRRKDAGGQWVDDPNYFDVTVWGQQGENCATYLQKGRPVAITGRLNWREWETEGGGKRQAVDIVAHSVQFLYGKEGADGGGGQRFTPESDVPADTSGFGTPSGGGDFGTPSGASAADDDIPF